MKLFLSILLAIALVFTAAGQGRFLKIKFSVYPYSFKATNLTLTSCSKGERTNSFIPSESRNKQEQTSPTSLHNAHSRRSEILKCFSQSLVQYSQIY